MSIARVGLLSLLCTVIAAAQSHQDCKTALEANRQELVKEIQRDTPEISSSSKLSYSDQMKAEHLAESYYEPFRCPSLEPDYEKARYWYAVVANSEDTANRSRAHYYLGKMFFEGKGGPVDRERAVVLLALEPNALAITYLKQHGYDVHALQEKMRAAAVERRKEITAEARAHPYHAPGSTSADRNFYILGGLLLLGGGGGSAPASRAITGSSSDHGPDSLQCSHDSAAILTHSQGANSIAMEEGMPATCK